LCTKGVSTCSSSLFVANNIADFLKLYCKYWKAPALESKVTVYNCSKHNDVTQCKIFAAMQYYVVSVVNIVLHQWSVCATADNNCTWSEWSAWSNCSHQCDVSQRNRTRQCLTAPCIGDAIETENCLRENCTGNVLCQIYLYVNYALRDLRLLILFIC